MVGLAERLGHARRPQILDVIRTVAGTDQHLKTGFVRRESISHRAMPTLTRGRIGPPARLTKLILMSEWGTSYANDVIIDAFILTIIGLSS